MPKQEAPLHQLKAYLPEGCFDEVTYYLLHYKVHLTITRERKTVLGDYRNSFADKNHRISVNGNLNKYAFLITLLHELAHLFTYERHGHRVQAHGQEWKNEYSKILAEFLLKKIFPPDIYKALLPPGSLFSIKGGRVFKKMEQVRKRFKCVETATGKIYLFSPVYEVEIVEQQGS
jgi:hypothetical protein